MNCGPGIPLKKYPANNSPDSFISRKVRNTDPHRKSGNSRNSASQQRLAAAKTPWSSAEDQVQIPIAQCAGLQTLAVGTEPRKTFTDAACGDSR